MIVRIHKIRLSVVNGISSLQSTEYTVIFLPKHKEVKDIKFVDDKTVIVAVADKCKCTVGVWVKSCKD